MILVVIRLNMSNPYKSPDTVDALSDGVSGRTTSWSTRIPIVLCAIAIAYFLFAAALLIPQAFRLANEATQLPVQFRNSSDAEIRGSWILGVFSVLFAALSASGVMFAMRNRIRSSWCVLGISILGFVGLAAVFRPM